MEERKTLDGIEESEADRIFARFPAYIRDFIYSHGWESLRGVQIAAARTLFLTDHHLLLTSSTASGKTEAAFFPILTLLSEEQSEGQMACGMPDDVPYRGNTRGTQSIGALYIAPLKSLINDQFDRMEELLRESGVKVTHWHGDVTGSHKKKLLEHPEGILQITPESLESMLINRYNDIPRLFCNLRFVIIDEIHTLVGSDRGNQIRCQIARITRAIGHEVRRIGLSATVGNPDLAGRWLAGDSGIPVDIPRFPEGKIRWRLGMEHFYIQNEQAEQTGRDSAGAGLTGDSPRAMIDAGYEYMYDCVKDKKSLVFSNSREETEYLTATFRQIAKRRGDRDIFLIHHGNLSSAIREEAEAKMKDEGELAVTCATVTMELGIDIGRLERILQNGAPNSVSSFLQRLGRSGRRGQPPEMMMVFREEDPLPNTPLPQLIPWELLRAIAIVQLYMEERFIEPPRQRQMPMSLLFHQTLSVLASSGELSVKRLADRVLSLPPFRSVEPADYKTLLVSMLNLGYLEMTEEKTLLIGLEGEKLLKSFRFYAVFKDTEDYTVRCESEEIGTITTPPPVGDRFALAGRVWEVEELDIQRHLVYVRSVDGKMEVSWPGDYGEIHTRILERMKQVLEEDTVYPYLKPNAMKRLSVARHVARNTGMLKHGLVCLGGYSYCLFPWLGTCSFRTMRKFLLHECGKRFGISGLEYEGCCYMTFRMEKGKDFDLISALAEAVETRGIDRFALVESGEAPVFEKYDEYIPTDLLRKAYALDKLRTDEAESRILEMRNAY